MLALHASFVNNLFVMRYSIVFSLSVHLSTEQSDNQSDISYLVYSISLRLPANFNKILSLYNKSIVT